MRLARYIRALLFVPFVAVSAYGQLSEPGVKAPTDEERIEQRLKARDAAWEEVVAAHRALREAEERFAAAQAPEEDEPKQLQGSAQAVAPEAGGAQSPAPASVGGPQAPASPAVGGPMSGRRQGGGGRQPAHAARMEALEAQVQAARARLDEAWRAYNELK